MSISRAVESDNDYWFYIKTASGTEGWVLGGYVKLFDRDLSYQERENRRQSLPAVGVVTATNLNVRNVPSSQSSAKIVEKLSEGSFLWDIDDIFATDNMDWYHVKGLVTFYKEGDEEEYEKYIDDGGWVSGKYIKIKTRSN